jgi:hypothetical protein
MTGRPGDGAPTTIPPVLYRASLAACSCSTLPSPVRVGHGLGCVMKPTPRAMQALGPSCWRGSPRSDKRDLYSTMPGPYQGCRSLSTPPPRGRHQPHPAGAGAVVPTRETSPFDRRQCPLPYAPAGVRMSEAQQPLVDLCHTTLPREMRHETAHHPAYLATRPRRMEAPACARAWNWMRGRGFEPRTWSLSGRSQLLSSAPPSAWFAHRLAPQDHVQSHAQIDAYLHRDLHRQVE